ncbi:MAG: FAD-binding oxidoreductase [Rhodobacteraceae bacterium]|jgi:glycine/D-amino acid oxidase-like deaminating enzyme|uniref:Glycine/D-amino acid oxidase, deaminating n=1 Tax=Salipiger profundus TaxID=1229727 RepID=A0A1U7D404_9RHOB|nr:MULTISPECIES: FAD-binding oxidoreductase [Salipiger]APX22879.1 glycine/D-amino acid oxidase, deaminating [Salipiger profundus]MAB05719.1 FAD-binding oxidoreductase [Paracoccaceae bacterium]GGA09005.1 oxidoreductase [Salipiger profundus]SFC57526.1 Glycine/D-amino acid oxidase [Salipiger profundus]
MKRIYEKPAYGPQGACFWADTVSGTDWPTLPSPRHTEVAIIGGGFTGVSAALHLAQDGVDVTVLEAEHAGYGASGRNGGFCCLGGAKASAGQLRRHYGPRGLAAWRRTEAAAIETAAGLIETNGIDADTHSEGETLIAHSARAFAKLRDEVDAIERDYGVRPDLIQMERMRELGMGGPFFGALTTPLGFALNPRKYHAGLARAARDAGAALFQHSPVTRLAHNGTWRLETPHGTVTADRVLLATNGYSSEDLPDWLRARYMPAQSSVIVTEPISEELREAQGWTTRQMAYDTRFLLHYFRLLPDNRFLFGMRGGLRASAGAQRRISRMIREQFAAMFPAWREVPVSHEWAGLVCLMSRLVPFAGPVPDHPGLFAGLGYHGNGVAMASHTGMILADLVQDKPPRAELPDAMRHPPGRFPLGAHRRALLAPAYAVAGLLDL